MERVKKMLVAGDYFQLYTYKIRKRLIYYWRNKQVKELIDLLNHLIDRKHINEVALKEDIQIMTIFDKEYPLLLLESYDPPLVLYCQGNIELLKIKNKIAMVGSREPQAQSMKATKKIIEGFKETKHLAIVSGLAKGIDSYSHELAIAYEIPTIAILGFGFDYFYPYEKKQLYLKMKQKGLVISEYPPHVGINKWQFIARNRIIAGLCQSTIIVEAKEKSGSLVTAEMALSENREVFIVSGHSFDTDYLGSNRLLQEGARLLLNVEEVLETYQV